MLHHTDEEIIEMYQRLQHKHIASCRRCRGTGKLIKGMTMKEGVPFFQTRDCKCKVIVSNLIARFEAGVPEELWSADTIKPTFNVDKYDLLRKFGESLADGLEGKAYRTGMSCLLTGENGAGKTSSACLALFGALDGQLPAALVSWPMVVSCFYDNRFKEQLLRTLRFRIYRTFVIFDEIGKETLPASAGDFAVGLLDEVIRYRRGHRLPTILITNYSVSQFTTRYGASIESLIAPPYRVLTYKPGDFRPRLEDPWKDL